jgi:ATP-dependent Clp protease ATP-binding subunit ClpC
MSFPRLDDEAAEALSFAQEEARTLRHDRIGTEHVLLGLLRLDGGSAVEALEALGVTLGRARAEVVRVVGPGSGAGGGQLPFTPRTRRRLELAGDEAEALASPRIAPEHLLLSIVREREGGAARVLERLGVGAQELRQNVLERLDRPVETPRRARAPLRSGAAWALPMLVGALLLGAGILVGWAIWG